MPSTELFIGLISGTSINSIDAVIVDFSTAQPKLLVTHEHAIPPSIHDAIFALARRIDDDPNTLDRLAQLDSSFARVLAEAVAALLTQANLAAKDIRAIGSHGQTVWHAPTATEPYTVQIGNPNLLTELTGILTVADFRRRDIAAGGQGAPLAPAFHAAFFADPTATQVIVNIGGIANITILPPDHSQIIGFDTGPGNTLLDAWAQRHLHTSMDNAGHWADTGTVDEALLQALLQDDYFQAPAPKSTGPEYFNLNWLQHYLNQPQSKPINAQDIQATLTALSAHSIALAIETQVDLGALKHVLVCGGGVHNPVLMQQLQARLATIAVLSTSAYGIDPDYIETMGFAWLARQTLAGLPGNIPAVTGARGPRVLGGIYPV